MLANEINDMFTYKAKCEKLRSENMKLLDNEEHYEDQIRDLRQEIAQLNREQGSLTKSQGQLKVYLEKIGQLEQQLKDERIDLDQSYQTKLQHLSSTYQK